MEKMDLVIVESPFRGDGDGKAARMVAVRYARAAMKACLERGEAPFASHLLYTQEGVLDDDVDSERALGIEAGLAWGVMAHRTVVYTDLGISFGMETGIDRAQAQGRPVELRTLPGWGKLVQGVAVDVCDEDEEFGVDSITTLQIRHPYTGELICDVDTEVDVDDAVVCEAVARMWDFNPRERMRVLDRVRAQVESEGLVLKGPAARRVVGQ